MTNCHSLFKLSFLAFIFSVCSSAKASSGNYSGIFHQDIRNKLKESSLVDRKLLDEFEAHVPNFNKIAYKFLERSIIVLPNIGLEFQLTLTLHRLGISNIRAAALTFFSQELYSCLTSTSLKDCFLNLMYSYDHAFSSLIIAFLLRGESTTAKACFLLFYHKEFFDLIRYGLQQFMISLWKLQKSPQFSEKLEDQISQPFKLSSNLCEVTQRFIDRTILILTNLLVLGKGIHRLMLLDMSFKLDNQLNVAIPCIFSTLLVCYCITEEFLLAGLLKALYLFKDTLLLAASIKVIGSYSIPLLYFNEILNLGYYSIQKLILTIYDLKLTYENIVQIA